MVKQAKITSPADLFFTSCLVLNPLYADCIVIVAFCTSESLISGRDSFLAFLALYLLKARCMVKQAKITSPAVLFFTSCLVLNPLYADCIVIVAFCTSESLISGRDSFLAFLALNLLKARCMVKQAKIT